MQGVLLGGAGDDIIVVLCRAADGVTVRMFDTVTPGPNQQTLVVAGAQGTVPSGTYRVILRVNNQQAKLSPSVVVP